MLGLDTSVVLRLLVGEPAGQAARARELLADAHTADGDALAVADLVVAESYHALVHHYKVPPAEALAALKALASDPGVHATGVARDVLHGAALTDPGLVDRLIQGGYDAIGARTVTFDRKMSLRLGAQLLGGT